MKFMGLLVVMALLVSFGGCTVISSAPRHSADEVASIAKSFSPTCQKVVAPANPTGHG